MALDFNLNQIELGRFEADLGRVCEDLNILERVTDTPLDLILELLELSEKGTVRLLLKHAAEKVDLLPLHPEYLRPHAFSS